MKTLFDRNSLIIKPLAERSHDLALSIIMDPGEVSVFMRSSPLKAVAERISASRKKGCPVILMMGAHVLRAGVQKFIIDLMERDYISCIAMNGAGIIHDYEFSLIGATTENVARYIKNGEFGLWKETGYLNDLIHHAYETNRHSGLGETIGSHIEESSLPYRSVSILAAAHRLGIPATVHVGIGYDILHEHPNCDGAATGALSYNDFLRLTRVIQDLEGGVVMNFGSAIMAPEVYLKALSMARNVAHRQGQEIRNFSTLVCDLIRLPSNLETEPPKNSPAYYFRPLKTMLIRTVKDGGKSFYVRGHHDRTIPSLWNYMNRLERLHGKSN
jgi:hypothetical protein